MNADCVIVDANIAFKALAANRGDLRDRLSPSTQLKFHSPRFLFVELFKHKERLSRAARLNEDELLEALHTLVSRLDFMSEANIPVGTWMEAYRLCKDVDEKDTPYILQALLDGQMFFAGRAPGTRLQTWCKRAGAHRVWRDEWPQQACRNPVDVIAFSS